MHPLAALAALVDFVFPPRAEELLVRGAAGDALLKYLQPELITQGRLSITTLASFEDDMVRACIKEAKYHSSTKAQELLATLLGEYLLELSIDTLQKSVLVPVPLSRTRVRERGFNQCEVIAKKALQLRSDVPLALLTDALVRMRDTEHQTRLSKSARRENVKDAFLATHELDPSYTYVLFDDVVTTGATLAACARALRERGARHIFPLTIARAS